MFSPTAGCRDIPDWPWVLPKAKAAEHCSAAWRDRRPREFRKVLITRPQYEARVSGLLFLHFLFLLFLRHGCLLGAGVKLRQGWFKSQVDRSRSFPGPRPLTETNNDTERVPPAIKKHKKCLFFCNLMAVQ